MIISSFLLILSFLLLYLSSRSLINRLFHLFSRLTHSQSTAVNLLFFLFLPGVFLHELSHILAAEILRVPTGHLSLQPQFKNNQLKLGSAQIASTDPLRLTLIGTAPALTGTFSIWLILKLGLNLHLTSLHPAYLFPQLLFLFNHTSLLHLLLFSYLLFSISNTMFSSSSDLQSAAFPFILLLLLISLFHFTSLSLPFSLLHFFTNLFSLLSTLFFFILLLNLLLLLILKLLHHQH